MAMSVEARDQLHQRLKEELGPEEALTFMEHMPPVGWADVATKRDLDALALAAKGDLDHLGSELRSETQVLGATLRAEMADLGGSLRAEMAELRVDLADGLRVQTYAILGGGSVLVGLGTVLSHLLT